MPRASTQVQAPFQGYFNDRPPHVIPPPGLSAGNNYRVRFNQIWFKDMGWLVQINGAADPGHSILRIPTNDTPSIVGGCLFTLTNAWQYLIVVTGGGDIYAINYSSPPAGFVDPTQFGSFAVFITPTYTTGTISNGGIGSTAITGAGGTLWNTAAGTGFRTNARVGDYIGIGSATLSNPTLVNIWFRITAVGSDTTLTIAADGQSIPNIPGGTAYTLRQRLSPNLSGARVYCEEFPNAGTPDNQDLLFITDHGGTQKATSVDPIVCWNPTVTPAAYMTTFSFTAKHLRRFNNVMIYGALFGVSGATPAGNLGNTSIQSSDNGLPKALASGVAFQGMVTDGAEPIQHLGVMGNQLLIYTGGQAPLVISQSTSSGQGGSIVSASFVGFPTVWQFSTVVRGRGTLGQGLVAEFADRHQFIAQDGEYRYNGMFLQMMNDHIFRGVLAALDWANLQQAFNIVDPQAGEVIWVLPTSVNGTNNIWAAYVEHYAEQANNYLFKPISVRDAGDQNTLITWQCFIGTIPNRSTLSFTGRQGPLIGDSSGNLIQIGLKAGNLQTWGVNAAIGFPCTATFGAKIVAGERARGLVKRVYPFVDEVDSSGSVLTVELDLWDRVGAAPAITDTKTYTTGTATRFTTHYRRGRVAQVKFTFNTTTDGLNMILDGYDWDLPKGSPGGQR